ncbi:hypothetical protein ACTXT7_009011 [Hymenolepis weldensis]
MKTLPRQQKNNKKSETDLKEKLPEKEESTGQKDQLAKKPVKEASPIKSSLLKKLQALNRRSLTKLKHKILQLILFADSSGLKIQDKIISNKSEFRRLREKFDIITLTNIIPRLIQMIPNNTAREHISDNIHILHHLKDNIMSWVGIYPRPPPMYSKPTTSSDFDDIEDDNEGYTNIYN